MAYSNQQEQQNTAKFKFNTENIKKSRAIIAKYPESNKRSAVMPLLYLAQAQNDNWISKEAMDYIAEMLQIPPMHVYEVANFYTMYNKEPIGKYLLQVCCTTPCWLRGSDDITESCQEHLGIQVGETSGNGLFTLVEVECLGACVNGPVVQINNDYYEDLTPDSMVKILDALKANKKPKAGSQTDRQCSAFLQDTDVSSK